MYLDLPLQLLPPTNKDQTLMLVRTEPLKTPDNSEMMWSDYVNTYKEKLYNIADDLTDRLMEGDHNLISGVVKFVKQYKLMVKSHAPNSSLSYALHNFGKSDSKLPATVFHVKKFT